MKRCGRLAFERRNTPCGVYSVVKNFAIRLSVVFRVGTQDVPTLADFLSLAA